MPLGNFIWFQVPVWTFFVLTQKIMDTVDRTSRPVDFKQDEETSWLQPNCRFGEKATGIESCPRPVLPRPSFVNFRDCSPGYYVRWEMAHTKSWTTHQTHLRQKLHMWPGQARERPLKFNTFILCLFCTLETVHTNHWCCVKKHKITIHIGIFHSMSTVQSEQKYRHCRRSCNNTEIQKMTYKSPDFVGQRWFGK